MKNATSLAFCFWLTGCGLGVDVSGKTEHAATVSGEVHTVNTIVLRIDVSACESLGGAAQAQCITESVQALGDLVELAKAFGCTDAECLGAGQ